MDFSGIGIIDKKFEMSWLLMVHSKIQNQNKKRPFKKQQLFRNVDLFASTLIQQFIIKSHK